MFKSSAHFYAKNNLFNKITQISGLFAKVFRCQILKTVFFHFTFYLVIWLDSVAGVTITGLILTGVVATFRFRCSCWFWFRFRWIQTFMQSMACGDEKFINIGNAHASVCCHCLLDFIPFNCCTNRPTYTFI